MLSSYDACAAYNVQRNYCYRVYDGLTLRKADNRLIRDEEAVGICILISEPNGFWTGYLSSSLFTSVPFWPRRY